MYTWTDIEAENLLDSKTKGLVAPMSVCFGVVSEQFTLHNLKFRAAQTDKEHVIRKACCMYMTLRLCVNH